MAIEKTIEPIPGVQLKFAEKGSFRDENNIAYYKHFTPVCTEVADCELWAGTLATFLMVTLTLSSKAEGIPFCEFLAALRVLSK